ncbi:hypothetical protein [Fibrivirga algicola]|uniref:Uncharacterized protein n=1 Tax=Fibrivirga algicola TaxID=2950420 RepID=A0ABX0QAC9_9BACT|nr:hypothetical protein [Fibrivirga algicola]NID08929.1 hypothetical protein [Fibrivirga algicola]
MVDITTRFKLKINTLYNEYLALRSSSILELRKDLFKSEEFAIACYHFGESLAMYFYNRDSSSTDSKAYVDNFIKEIKVNCFEFALLEDIANVSKHDTLSQKKSYRAASSITQMNEVIYYITFKDELGEYSHIEKGVSVILNDGSTKDVLDIMTSVMNMWYKLLYKHNLIRNIRVYEHSESAIIPRNLSNNLTKDIEIVFSIGSILYFDIIQQKYNYTTCKREHLHVKENLSIYVKGGNPKAEIELKIPINRVELNYFKRLATKKEKNNFINRISERENLISLFTDEQRDILWSDEETAQFTSCITYKGITFKRDLKLNKAETLEYRSLPSSAQKKEYIDKLIVKKKVVDALHQDVFNRWPNDFKQENE